MPIKTMQFTSSSLASQKFPKFPHPPKPIWLSLSIVLTIKYSSIDCFATYGSCSCSCSYSSSLEHLDLMSRILGHWDIFIIVAVSVMPSIFLETLTMLAYWALFTNVITLTWNWHQLPRIFGQLSSQKGSQDSLVPSCSPRGCVCVWGGGGGEGRELEPQRKA